MNETENRTENHEHISDISWLEYEKKFCIFYYWFMNENLSQIK